MSSELKTPKEWEKVVGIEVWDPDGWRSGIKLGPVNLRPRSYEDPITEQEFLDRCLISTILGVNIFAEYLQKQKTTGEGT